MCFKPSTINFPYFVKIIITAQLIFEELVYWTWFRWIELKIGDSLIASS